MTELLKQIVSLSLSGSILILLLLLLRPVLRDRVSKRWQYYIWLLVAARLVLPVAPPVSPVGNAVIEMQTAAEDVLIPASARDADTNPAFSPEAPEPEAASWRQLGLAVWENLWVIWLAGAALLLIRKITAYQSFSRCIKAGWEPVGDPALLDLVAETGAELGIKRPVELYVNPIAASPMLLGLRKPRIVLPTAELSAEDLRYVILHELTHCRRQDLLYKWLIQVTVCIHWFNPLVHWMSHEVERLGELSCDESVLRRLDEDGRRAYGDALLRTMAAGGGYKPALPSATLGESGELLKERLETIMNGKKPTKLAALLSVLLAAALSVTAVAAGAYTGVSADQHRADEYGVYWEHILPGSKEKRFTTEAVYQEPYMFTIGWNAQAQDKYVPVKLPDGSTMKVWLGNSTLLQWFRQDPKALDALSEVIAQLWKDSKDTDFPLTSPLLFYYQNVGESTPAELVERYYDKDYDLAAFKASFAKLSAQEKMTWLLKIYEDEEIAYFSLAVDSLKVDSDTVKTLAERFYKDGAIAYFSVLSSRMSEEMLKAWAERAEKDGKTAFRVSLLGKLDDGKSLDKLKAELEKQQSDEYAKLGVTTQGKDRYYDGKLVNIFLDQRPDSSFCTLDMNPKGSINIKIVHDAAGNRTGVAYLTQAEVEELFGDDFEDVDWDKLRNMDDAKPEEDDDWDWDWDWDESEDSKYAVDKQQSDEYAKLGITIQGKDRYYDGKLVNIFVDNRPGSSFYTLDMNPKGSINIKIIYDAAGNRTGAAYLTQAEIKELFGGGFEDTGWDEPENSKYIVDKELDRVADGAFVFLGTFEMKKGDRIYYDASAETGKNLTIGFAKAGDKNPSTVYTTVSNNRTDDELEIHAGPLTWGVADGKYSLFVHAKSGALTDVEIEARVLAAD